MKAPAFGIRSITTFLVLGPMVSAVLIFGFLALRTGIDSVNIVTGHLAREVNDQVVTQVEYFLDNTHQIIDINGILLGAAHLDTSDQEELQSYFHRQMALYRDVSSIYFANTEGGLAGSGIDDSGPYVTGTDGFRDGRFYKIRVDRAAGGTGELVFRETVTEVPDFDARTREWYRRALAEAGPIWSRPYVLITGQDMAIAAARPALDGEGNLLGVAAVDVFLSRLSTYLAEVDDTPGAHHVVLDAEGYLVAASGGRLVSFGEEGNVHRRLKGTEHSSPVVRRAAFLLEQAGYDGQTRELRFTEGTRYNLLITPVRASASPDWYALTVIPESVFLGEIVDLIRVALITLLTVSLMILVLVLRASWTVLQPVLKLVHALETFTGGEPPAISGRSGIREIDALIGSFDRMADKLNYTMSRLRDEITERREAVEDREVLIRELHHRTRNNMNVISSMLRLRRATVTDDAAVQALDDIDLKIQSMAEAHRMLHQSGKFSHVDLADYLRVVSGMIADTLDFHGRDIRIQYNLESMDVPVDAAIPCGMVVHELVTNAGRHAFGRADTGTIGLILRREGFGVLSLTVTDDGVGFPDSVIPALTESLGIQTVYAVVEHQLGGTVTFSSTDGVTCHCKFSFTEKTNETTDR
jgi:two-component sensor histidine kinase